MAQMGNMAREADLFGVETEAWKQTAKPSRRKHSWMHQDFKMGKIMLN